MPPFETYKEKTLVQMKIHANQLNLEIERLRVALYELLDASEKDCGVPTEHDEDDEPVGSTKAEGGPIQGTAMTFGILRRARAALNSQ